MSWIAGRILDLAAWLLDPLIGSLLERESTEGEEL